jgi:hypothetical protein
MMVASVGEVKSWAVEGVAPQQGLAAVCDGPPPAPPPLPEDPAHQPGMWSAPVLHRRVI